MYTSETHQTGIQFMIVHKISELIDISSNYMEGNNNVAILTKQAPVFIFSRNVKELIYTFYDRDVLLKY